MPALEVGATHRRLPTAYADTDVRPRAPGGRTLRLAQHDQPAVTLAGVDGGRRDRAAVSTQAAARARLSRAQLDGPHRVGIAAVAAAQEGPTAAVALGQLGDHGQQAVDLAGLDSGRSAEPALDAEAAERTGDGRVVTAELRRDRVSRPALEFVPLAQPVLIVQFPIAERHQGDVLARHQAQPYAGVGVALSQVAVVTGRQDHWPKGNGRGKPPGPPSRVRGRRSQFGLTTVAPWLGRVFHSPHT